MSVRFTRAGWWIGALVVAVSLPAAAQPDWLPPEVAEARRRRQAAQANAVTDACADSLLGVLAPPLRDTGLDRALDACLAGGYVARARAATSDVDAREDSAISGELELRWMYLADLELTVGARAVRWLTGEAAEFSDEEEASFGPVYLSAAADHGTRAFDRPLRLAWALRFEVPWTHGVPDSPVVAASPQVAAALQLGRSLSAHARAAALLWLVLPEDDVERARALSLSTDLTWAPWRWLAGGLGVEVQRGWFGDGFDHLAARGGLRLPLGCRARVELTAAAPLAGRESTDLVVELGLTVDR